MKTQRLGQLGTTDLHNKATLRKLSQMSQIKTLNVNQQWSAWICQLTKGKIMLPRTYNQMVDIYNYTSYRDQNSAICTHGHTNMHLNKILLPYRHIIDHTQIPPHKHTHICTHNMLPIHTETFTEYTFVQSVRTHAHTHTPCGCFGVPPRSLSHACLLCPLVGGDWWRPWRGRSFGWPHLHRT